MHFDESDRISEWGVIRIGGPPTTCFNVNCEGYCERFFMHVLNCVQGAAKEHKMPGMAKTFHHFEVMMSEINFCAIPGLKNLIFVGFFN